jgi:hypothetical protein
MKKPAPVGNDQLTCNNCGWVHFGVSREYVEKQTQEFGDYWDAADKETKESFWSRAVRGPMPDLFPRAEHALGYTKCQRCRGSYTNFRESKEGDCPNGCTIGPILNKFDIDNYT